MKEIHVFKEIFNVELKKEDLNENIENIIDWDSFSIMEFMSEISDRYNYIIDIEQVSKIVTVGDLIELIRICIK